MHFATDNQPFPLLHTTGAGVLGPDGWLLAPIHFKLYAGERVGVVGESGSGKTTLLKMLGGHAQATTGGIFFKGKKVWGPQEQLLSGHEGIAYLSQHFELRNNYWVHEILSYANQLEADEAMDIYRDCDVLHLMNRRTNGNLSGGEKQRLVLASLLTTKPELLLLDEPFSNLDALHQQQMERLLALMSNKYGITLMQVTHQPADVLAWATQVLVLQKGTVVQQGRPEDVFFSPTSHYVAGLFGAYNVVPIGVLPVVPDNPPPMHGLFVRASQIELLNKQEAGISGLIIHKAFKGSYTTYTIQVNSFQWKANHTNCMYEVGSEVGLGFAISKPCYLPLPA